VRPADGQLARLGSALTVATCDGAVVGKAWARTLSSIFTCRNWLYSSNGLPIAGWPQPHQSLTAANGAACLTYRYFLRKLRRVKKANGQIVSVNEVSRKEISRRRVLTRQ
jgi:hypothetical protein